MNGKTTMNRENYYFLNEDSRTFLSRGYLSKGQTPEQRYEEIAENAERILGFEGFAEKFLGYVKKGYYSLATPVMTNFGNQRGLPVSCVAGDSWINTIDGGKRAKDIVLGDMVLTHRGRYRKVTNIIPTKDKGDIYMLKVKSRMTPIKITGDHLVKTNLGWTRVDELDPNEHLVATNMFDQLSKNKHRQGCGVKFEDGLCYYPISKVEKTNLVLDVYDFTVEEDHSFSVAGVVVHNCFSSFIPDTMEGILDKVAEVGMMTKYGGGTSGYFGDLRPRGAPITDNGESSGPVHFMQLFDKTTQIVSQGSARRGSFAAYLPVDHPDILEFLQIRANENPIQDMSFGVTITDKWMEEMVKGDKKKREIWAKIIRKRYETGYPYVVNIDNVNNVNPKIYKDKGLSVKCQNLCAEICLHSDEENSFVCVLSSINLLHWDEIKNTDAVETLTYFLEAVNEEFVRKTEGNLFMSAANNFAKNHRALGLGVLGWHSYLQSKMIPFESMEAKMANASIFKLISEKTLKATKEMAVIFGETELTKGYGVRNTHTMAVAPTTSSSFILGQVSPSIEPLNSNYFVKKLAKGNFTYKNPYLEKLLESKNKNTEEVWKSILIKGGSVQHLNFLSQEEKDVFKTFSEVSQKEVIIQAAQRQKYIDQGQSLNVMIPASASPKEVSELMIFAWEQGVKSLYYQRSSNPSQDLSRSILECKSCEG